MNQSNYEKLFQMPFSNIYASYVAKAQRKNRTEQEVRELICWLTGYSEAALTQELKNQTSVQAFYTNCPKLNEKASLITGTICGVKLEEITDPLIKKVRWLDKLIDELAKGKPMHKILR